MFDKLRELIDDQRKTLRLYALGALLFFIGVGFIQGANSVMQPSLGQEVYALLGTLVAGTGFCIAMLAQTFLIVFRFRRMGKKDPPADK